MAKKHSKRAKNITTVAEALEHARRLRAPDTSIGEAVAMAREDVQRARAEMIELINMAGEIDSGASIPSLDCLVRPMVRIIGDLHGIGIALDCVEAASASASTSDTKASNVIPLPLAGSR
jgi:hypothetical protein